MRSADRSQIPACLVPLRVRHAPATSASSEAAERQRLPRRSTCSNPLQNSHGQRGLQARLTAENRPFSQQPDKAVLPQRRQTCLALQSGQAALSPCTNGRDSGCTDGQAGITGQLYLAWWDRLTRHCVLASTVLLAASFAPAVAGSALPAGTAAQSPMAWTVRAATLLAAPAAWRMGV